jgi:hypothetical protein
MPQVELSAKCRRWLASPSSRTPPPMVAAKRGGMLAGPYRTARAPNPVRLSGLDD